MALLQQRDKGGCEARAIGVSFGFAFLIPSACTVGGTGRFIAALLPPAAGCAFGPGVGQGMGDGEDLFQTAVSAIPALEGIAPRPHSLPDLRDATTRRTAVFIDGHIPFSSGADMLWILFLFPFLCGKGRVIRGYFNISSILENRCDFSFFSDAAGLSASR